MMRFLSLLATLGMATILWITAHAEIVLYDRPNQQGDPYTLRNPHQDLDDAGFRNRAQSMIVRDGAWQVCSEVNFSGTCQVVKPGRYDTLGQFSRHIASAQPIGDQGPSASDGRPDGPVTSCAEPRDGYCHACAISCYRPGSAVCTPGYSYPAPRGHRYGECAHEATCECVGG